MKRQILLPALAALSLFAVPSTLAASSPMTMANGNDVLLTNGDVYQLGGDGTYHWIPNVATANAMHLDWNNMAVADQLDAPVGDALPSVT